MSTFENTKQLPVTILTHTLNEEINLPYALNSVKGKFNQIVIVDSGSTDRTVEIAKQFNADIYVRENNRRGLVEQRNWALDNVVYKNEWVFVLDADEQMPDDLYQEITDIINNNPKSQGYWVRYKNIFLNTWVKNSSIYPNWNMRLFKHKLLRYENRKVNAHVHIDNKDAGWIKAHFIHDDKKGFKAYLKRLAEIVVVESEALGDKSSDFKGSIFSKSNVIRRRALKNIYYKLPGKPLIMFLYLYVFKLGFLEGKPGLYYSLFRSMVDLSIDILKYEKQMKLKNKMNDK